MTTLDLALLAAIDQRVSLGQERTTALGVVASVTGDNDGMVTFDGSTMAVPVKLAGDADFMPGDRVALAKFGLWWVALVPLTRRWSSFAHAQTQQVAGGSTVSATYVDIPNPTDITLTKRWKTTGLQAQVSAGSFCSAIPCEAHFGVRVTSSTGAATTTFVINAAYGAGADRVNVTDSIVIPALAADTYTCRVMWRRNGGTGTVQTDGVQYISLTVAEVSP